MVFGCLKFQFALSEMCSSVSSCGCHQEQGIAGAALGRVKLTNSSESKSYPVWYDGMLYGLTYSLYFSHVLPFFFSFGLPLLVSVGIGYFSFIVAQFFLSHSSIIIEIVKELTESCHSLSMALFCFLEQEI
ncbi:hypothetical protein SLEP1_g40865 [Rubroshorea leprosula]|uniref:Uncharacterized protein n=1 Tax=Rubroshorea leprosula TaxID=152421 RepID=A0AAV5L552_9ROSI|nr:hypothetical protein SLEP1_g40865 [Rubroshorea leprosula]